tara:strand:- start:311 stop:505 length:195 start_codon:yes stop_codon:yes gene_type:complete
MMNDRYFIIDYGRDMLELAEVNVNYLKENNYHTVIYLTDLPDNLMVNEVTQEKFLDHFALLSEN